MREGDGQDERAPFHPFNAQPFGRFGPRAVSDVAVAGVVVGTVVLVGVD